MTLILMTIQSIKAYTNNYIWLIVTNEGNLLSIYKESYPNPKIIKFKAMNRFVLFLYCLYLQAVNYHQLFRLISMLSLPLLRYQAIFLIMKMSGIESKMLTHRIKRLLMRKLLNMLMHIFLIPINLNKLLEKGRYFIYFVLEELERYRLPPELALLPYIESNYDPFSISASGAMGIWQFMPATARIYGLKDTWWYEQRHDPLVSSKAAVSI